MRVVFPFDGHEHLGLGYLAAAARRAGHEPVFVPIDVGDYISGYRAFTSLKRDLAVRRVLAARPDVIAFSLVSPTAGATFEVARSASDAGVPCLAGGPHATAEPRVSLEAGRFAALVRGEADGVFARALDAATGETDDEPWLDTPTHQATERPPLPDVDELPVPEKDAFYRHVPRAASDYTIITARGCPYRCTFCSGAHREGARATYRRRSPENVVEELEWATRRYGSRSVYVLDDVFTLNRAWLDRFLFLYSRRIALPFHAITHPRHLDADVARALRQAGCFSLRMGVQTLTADVRAWMRRTETEADIAGAIDAARRAGISLEVDHMLDLPGETPEDVGRAIAFYNDHRPSAIKVYWLMPLPGSPWFAEAGRRGAHSAEQMEAFRRGRGFGPHSYLFARSRGAGRRWLGSHLLLAFLPSLPRVVVRALLAIRANRWLQIPSFVLLVGVSRLSFLLRRRDRVGEGHVRRLISRLRPHGAG